MNGRVKVLVLADFDGTLCEFKSKPRLARLSPARRALLRRLNAGSRRLGILSGRGLEDLQERVGIPGALYASNHGLEMKGPGWRFRHPRLAPYRGALDELARRLERVCRELPPAWVEDKTWSLSLHERGLGAGDLKKLRSRIGQLRRGRGGPPLRWIRGKLAWEILPDLSWDKGDAARLFWERLGRPFLVTLGDEHFDEGMFRAARGRGLAVSVGRHSDHASLTIKDVESVYRFLLTII